MSRYVLNNDHQEKIIKFNNITIIHEGWSAIFGKIGLLFYIRKIMFEDDALFQLFALLINQRSKYVSNVDH